MTTLYEKNFKIESMDDVEDYFYHLRNELNTQQHPDDPFEPFTLPDGTEFTDKECKLYDRLMDECFTVCVENCRDIYGVALDIYQSKDGLGKEVREHERK